MAQQRGQDPGRESNRGDTSHRGFASMDPEKQRAIAAEGGRAAHAQGVAHEFDSEEARQAGRKGGQARASDSNRMSGSDRDMQTSDRSRRPAGQRERDSHGRFTDNEKDNDSTKARDDRNS